ncbi:MAG: hypothetical protein K9H48_01035 [Melioribacteraceae bacterium]|nr:hypothetical protein [Melioribacteraceae bacterium]MCF8392891.1 hypothetical protein [Melioribacteraceae bacterium]MCF8417815.1 hypothetical protein [Melioribacteraceae bacterium]
MTTCFFVSDLHGNVNKYAKLFDEIKKDKPALVFNGGDLLPSFSGLLKSRKNIYEDFIIDYLMPEIKKLKTKLASSFPSFYFIMGNDDPKIEEVKLNTSHSNGLWEYIHFKKSTFGEYKIYGYNYVPPTPFQLKDWERYDVSRFVDPGSISPEDGRRTVDVDSREQKYSTIKKDLENLIVDTDLSKSILLFHSPPYKTDLDRAALDGKKFDHVQLDLHVGSIAIKELIEKRQPYITMHGHVHESSQITGQWHQSFGRTNSFNAAYSGKELSIIKFILEEPESAERVLL